jgi:hydrogenase expression/formation protein HypE
MNHENRKDIASFACPIPISQYPNVLLAHGGGGRLTHELIEKMFLPAFDNPLLEARHDGAVFAVGSQRLAFTTDSYVVRPLFFPGGNIGSLAVNGTINDLAMCGSRPLLLGAGFILEEGLPMDTLWRVTQAMQQAALQSHTHLATGDTKVVDRGKGDGIFINTSGIGIVEHNLTIAPSSIRQDDVVILSGDVGRHGIAIMAAREDLEFETKIESDCAPLADIVLALLNAGIEIHCLRDLTRGGLASALIEIAEAAEIRIGIEEAKVPLLEEVRGACEMLGLDPFYVANEGRFVCFVPPRDAQQTLAIMRSHAVGAQACIIGTVADDKKGLVTLKTTIGATRIVDAISGEQLPRIC